MREKQKIYEKNKSGKNNIILRLNILKEGINLWHNFETNVLKSEILLEERGIAQKNFNELGRMKVKMELAFKEYLHLDKETIQNQVTILLTGKYGMKGFSSKILANLRKL
ncbi:MAG: hypothetical protein U9R34_08800 [Nanoarchaeota archaeon]|nr:hypothetical protein [Nanoarchaeota archaeon]